MSLAASLQCLPLRLHFDSGLRVSAPQSDVLGGCTLQCLSLWLHSRSVATVAGLYSVSHCGCTLTVCVRGYTLTVSLSVAACYWAHIVPQPGRTGPSWYCASARPRRTQLVLCLSQAAPNPAGIVPQPGRTGPSWYCALARPHRTQLVCPGPSWVDGFATVSLSVVLTVAALPRCFHCGCFCL